jgi:antitoxin (DNA-binding transcriptional repressor) of toxin-antitoxin stability system
MGTTTVTVTEAARHFSDYISRVAYRHESFVLCKGKKPVAELRPLPSGRRLGDLPGILRSLPHLTKRDAAAFAKEVDAARKAIDENSGLRDPWAS